MLFLTDDESHFNDSMEISLPKNVVAGSVHAVVSTVGKWSLVTLVVVKHYGKVLGIFGGKTTSGLVLINFFN